MDKVADGLLVRKRSHFFNAFVNFPIDKRNPEPTFFVIVVGSAVTGEFNGCAHFFKDLKVVVETTFGDADLVSAV